MRVQAQTFRNALPTDPREVAQLALDLDVSVTTIWRWRTGRSLPDSAAKKLRVANKLGHSVDTLFGSADRQAA